MSTIKKTFQAVHDVLLANQTSTVADVMDQILPLMSAKSRGAATGTQTRTFLKTAEGEVVAILDYYFKRWMPLVGPLAVDFGTKKGSTTGFNSMCKNGLSNWTKQQAEAKKALEQILADVESGELEAADISSRREVIEAERKQIAATDLGFETLDEVKVYLEDYGVDLA